MKLDISQSRVDLLAITEAIEKVSAYHDHLNQVVASNTYDAPESSINLPGDLSIRDEVEKMYQATVSSSLKYVFVCGIGGSSLGTRAVYEAMRGDEKIVSNSPQLVFLESVDGAKLEQIQTLEVSSPDEVLIVVISKSGDTTETIANAELVSSILKDKCDTDLSSRTVVITGKESALHASAESNGMHVLHLPDSVGGRYSVLTPVGLFPLLCAQIDIDGLLSGAMDMRNMCLNGEMAMNSAMQSSVVLYMSNKAGKTINTNFIFRPELESLGKWYRQLMGESIGKEKDLDGTIVNAGLTPEVSVGSTDLHSMAQLYMEGPRDKITTFISVKKSDKDHVVQNRIFPSLVAMIDGKSVSTIRDAILSGTKTAYQKSELPFMSVELSDVSTYEIGQFLQFKMLEMMYLGKLLHVNTFNQPGVEAYKTETKNILE